jgi:hypothetical protein
MALESAAILALGSLLLWVQPAFFLFVYEENVRVPFLVAAAGLVRDPCGSAGLPASLT